MPRGTWPEGGADVTGGGCRDERQARLHVLGSQFLPHFTRETWRAWEQVGGGVGGRDDGDEAQGMIQGGSPASLNEWSRILPMGGHPAYPV